jgi:hypothetical protein
MSSSSSTQAIVIHKLCIAVCRKVIVASQFSSILAHTTTEAKKKVFLLLRFCSFALFVAFYQAYLVIH